MMKVKKSIESNSQTCARMMHCRTACFFAAIPFGVKLLAHLSAGPTGDVRWTLMLIAVPLVPMLYFMFQLVAKTNGIISAGFHVLLTAALTPFFLTGPLFIPLLVRGDALRLGVIRHTESLRQD